MATKYKWLYILVDKLSLGYIHVLLYNCVVNDYDL